MINLKICCQNCGTDCQRRTGKEEEYVRKSLKEHEEIVESIRKGDAMECYLRMQKHIKSSCENFVQRYN